MSYMSLSLTYLVIICLIAIVTLVITAMFFKQENMILGILSILLGAIGVMATHHVGVKYGRYGLSILLGKILQPNRLENRHPYMFKNVIDDKKKS